MRTLLLIFAALLAAVSLHAEELQLEAGFNPDRAEVGETVQFAIQIIGLEQPEQEPTLKVEGLDITFRGVDERTGVRQEGRFLRQITLTSYIYEVTPRRAGEFVVPALSLSIGGRVYSTKVASLRVHAASGPAGGADRNAQAAIILPKTTAYVGESLVTDLRLSVDEQLRARAENLPILEAEAFTKSKPGDVRTSSVVRNGRRFDVVTARTALTPTKAGKLTVGPVEFQFAALIPRPQGRSQGWFDPFFGNPMNGFGQYQRMTASSDVVELTVKPLPVADRPANFSGAVGKFELSAKASPTRVRMGDPITVTITVRGAGNFDRVTAPALSEPAGWRAYPPTATYKGQDTTGVNGAKNFEIAIIPEERKQEMPVYEFSYFDPVAEEYKTLKTEHMPLVVEGEAPTPATPETRGPTLLTSPAATPAPPPKPNDILGPRYDVGEVRTAQPMYSQRTFLLAQLVPFGCLCGMLAVRFWPRNRQSRTASALQRERSELLSRLRREPTGAGFFAAAARILHVDAALRRERGAGVVELATADEAPVAREIMENHAQAHFSGGIAPADTPLPAEDRRRILHALLPLLNRP